MSFCVVDVVISRNIEVFVVTSIVFIFFYCFVFCWKKLVYDFIKLKPYKIDAYMDTDLCRKMWMRAFLKDAVYKT